MANPNCETAPTEADDEACVVGKEEEDGKKYDLSDNLDGNLTCAAKFNAEPAPAGRSNTPEPSCSEPEEFLAPKNPQSRHGGLPPTPDPTPTHLKRVYSDFSNNTSEVASPSKRLPSQSRRLQPQKVKSLFHGTPKFSILYKTPPPEASALSADELKRTSEAVLSQIDWEEVGEYVASNRRLAVYKKAIKDILQEKVTELFEWEECEEAMR
ncbi:hypothetical protein MMC20_003440 [Loxospora ochrophaea]|nr:hypothetical protein [Loxospora ochrophaea]